MNAALITGSAVRLGREIALRLSTTHFIFIHYRNSRREANEVLTQIKKRGGQGVLVQGDMGSPKDIKRMLGEIKQHQISLEILVNNVGEYITGPLLKFSPEDFERTLQVNVSACFRLIQGALPLFPKHGGAIVNIGYAGVESLTGTTHNTAYLISKTGLFILTKSLAQALGSKNIRVNMVSPGILSNSVEKPKKTAQWVPLGRLGSVSDVADAVEFLVGDKSSYVTGVNLDISGGYHLSLKSFETEVKR